MLRRTLAVLAALALSLPLCAQTNDDLKKALARHDTNNDRAFEEMIKRVDDALWIMKLEDVARVEKYRIASTRPRREENATDQNAGNSILIPVYVFTPKNLTGKAPMLVFVHGGVHGDHESAYSHILRELLGQGYVIVAPEYRGSTGYGEDLYDQIDYGGAEIDDTHDARNWAVEMLPQVDSRRVGILGWSHGGYHTLMNIFRWPKDYQVAYAGVPVSDLVQRMGYKGAGYQALFTEFIGKSAADNVAEYKRRSPAFLADKLETPLLIHTNTNDEDVNVLEVEHLISALKAAGKKFEYKIYQNAPGGHQFNRIDTRLARDSRQEAWDFLAKYLK